MAASATGTPCTSRSEYGSGGDEPGSTSIDVSRVEGSFDIPNRVHALDDSGDYVVETITIEAGAYYREASSRGDLDDEPWIFHEMDEGVPVWTTTGPSTVSGVNPAGFAGATGVLGALGAPFDLGELLGRLQEDVRRVSPGVLEASLPLRELLPADVIAEMEKFAAEYRAEFEKNAAELEDVADDLDLDDQFSTDFLDDPVTIRLVHAPDGRLDELTIASESGEGEDRSVERGTLAFFGWGESVQIDVPAPADVDFTPGIDEDDVAAFRSFPLLAPQSLPDGFVLQSAQVEPEDAEIETCEAVNLSYGPRVERGEFPDAGMSLLEMNLTSASCRWTDSTGYYGEEGPGEPIQVGAHAAQLHRIEDGFFGGEDEPYVHVRHTVGDTAVDAYSNLPQDQLVAALASLGAFDLASQPVDRLPPPPGG